MDRPHDSMLQDPQANPVFEGECLFSVVFSQENHGTTVVDSPPSPYILNDQDEPLIAAPTRTSMSKTAHGIP